MIEPRSHTVFRNKIEEEINNLSGHIVSGESGDYAEYKLNVGIIQGLRMALDFLDETNKEIAGGG